MMGKHHQVNRNDVDECFGDEEDGYIINSEEGNQNGLSHLTTIGQSPAPLDENEVRSSPMDIKQQQIPENDEESVNEQSVIE